MAKVHIQIMIDDLGQVQFASTSKNLVTILGLLEIAREGFLNKLKAEPTNIVVPEIN